MAEQKVICGDSLEIMKTFADKSFDLVLTDPPYGIGIDGADSSFKEGVQIRKGYEWAGWDKEIPDLEHFKEMQRVSKNMIIFGANYFHEFVQHGFKGWVIWDKAQRDLTMSDCEIIYTTFQKPTRIFTQHRAHLWAEKPQHPTQKPLELLRWLIDKFTEENQTILDPFGGSGTTAVAAKYLNRNCTVIEISEKYCEIARNRLSQQQLF